MRWATQVIQKLTPNWLHTAPPRLEEHQAQLAHVSRQLDTMAISQSKLRRELEDTGFFLGDAFTIPKGPKDDQLD